MTRGAPPPKGQVAAAGPVSPALPEINMVEDDLPTDVLADIADSESSETERHVRKLTADYIDDEWEELIEPAFVQVLIAVRRGKDVEARFDTLVCRLYLILDQIVSYSEALNDVTVEEEISIEYDIEQ